MKENGQGEYGIIRHQTTKLKLQVHLFDEQTQDELKLRDRKTALLCTPHRAKEETSFRIFSHRLASTCILPSRRRSVVVRRFARGVMTLPWNGVLGMVYRAAENPNLL